MYDNRRLTLRIPAELDDALTNYATARFQTKTAAVKEILVKEFGFKHEVQATKRRQNDDNINKSN